jgi:DNA-binding transcriptional ArsR family regulator
VTDENDEAIRRYDWERIVKRARMNPSAKLVAFALATYAGKAGGHAYPGNDKLAAVTGLSEKTVRSALKTLRGLGLVERTYEGSRHGRRGLADEYRLRWPHGIERRVHMLDPTESLKSVDCSDDCQHPGTPVTSSGDVGRVDPASDGVSQQEHRNSVPGTPVMSSGTPVMSSGITGNHYRPSVHGSSPGSPHEQPRTPVRNLTTEEQAALLEQLREVDRLAAESGSDT